jgi:hypothetical protein
VPLSLIFSISTRGGGEVELVQVLTKADFSQSQQSVELVASALRFKTETSCRLVKSIHIINQQ